MDIITIFQLSTSELTRLDRGLLVLNYFSFFVALYLAIKTNKLNSTLLALGIMIFLNSLMALYTPLLEEMAKEYQKDYKHVFRAIWYLGFALIDLTIISLVFFTHYKFNLKKTFCAYAVVVTYSIIMQLHLFRYIEREIGKTEYLKEIYTNGIPLINILFSSAVLGFMFFVLVTFLISNLNKKYGFYKFKKGISWSI